MSYELEKELGIQKALVADLESKLSNLHVELDFTKQEKAGFQEQLAVNELVYKAQIKKLYAELSTSNRRGVEALRIMKADEVKFNSQRETYDVYIEDIQDKLDTQKDVLEGVAAENQLLTEQVSRLKEESMDLKAQVRELRYRASVTEKLEKVLQTFE